jgi:hypothetical protein
MNFTLFVLPHRPEMRQSLSPIRVCMDYKTAQDLFVAINFKFEMRRRRSDQEELSLALPPCQNSLTFVANVEEDCFPHFSRIEWLHVRVTIMAKIANGTRNPRLAESRSVAESATFPMHQPVTARPHVRHCTSLLPSRVVLPPHCLTEKASVLSPNGPKIFHKRVFANEHQTRTWGGWWSSLNQSLINCLVAYTPFHAPILSGHCYHSEKKRTSISFLAFTLFLKHGRPACPS